MKRMIQLRRSPEPSWERVPQRSASSGGPLGHTRWARKGRHMDIVIVGAGVGGLALANGLVADGHSVQVLERADGPGTDGAAVTVFSNGAAAAAGLEVSLDGLGVRIDTLGFFDLDGRPFAHADLTKLHRWSGCPVTTIPRGQLLHRLASGLPAETIRYGEQLGRVETTGSGAAVVTTEGVRRE